MLHPAPCKCTRSFHFRCNLLWLWWLWKESVEIKKKTTINTGGAQGYRSCGLENCCRVFTIFSRIGPLLIPLSFIAVTNSSLLPLSLWSLRRSLNTNLRTSKRLAWAAVKLGFPIALTRAVVLVWARFCWIQSFICWAGDQIGSLERQVTREGCVRIFSKASSARCAPTVIHKHKILSISWWNRNF